MSKAGNAHLRAAAYHMAVVEIPHDPVIEAHYERKRAAGKSKMNALGHSMSKALSLVRGVWRNEADWDRDWAHGLDEVPWDPGGPVRRTCSSRDAAESRVAR